MDLHRRKRKPDWEYVASDKQNVYQKLAAKTGGIITPANLSTVTGLALVFYGSWLVLENRVLAGALFIGVGRMIDLIDGVIAERSGTKSHVGEAFDSIADKLTALVVFVVFWLVHIVPAWLIVFYLILQLMNSYVTVRSKLHSAEIHTSPAGKKASFTMWLTIGLFATAFVAPIAIPGGLLGIIAYVSFAVSAVFGVQATTGYWSQYKSTP